MFRKQWYHGCGNDDDTGGICVFFLASCKAKMTKGVKTTTSTGKTVYLYDGVTYDTFLSRELARFHCCRCAAMFLRPSHAQKHLLTRSHIKRCGPDVSLEQIKLNALTTRESLYPNMT